MLGTKLAHYEITSHLGSGGMGDVYQATDSKLGRNVAVKFLSEAFAGDTDRVARFEREARVLAALNHPNIAAIHGLEDANGKKFLVMELVPGETLAERIARGVIPLDESLAVAKQIAEALEAAHEKGVIHRDLKPANVKITPDGRVKVLDFGLAKAFESDASNANLSNSPTMMSGGSMPGMILGTAAYMSPEQAKGRAVDKRTDIFAFGCVLYEMLTGRMMFSGETASETMAAVMMKEPEWNALRVGTPNRIRDLLRRCVAKDPRNRIRDIGDVRIAIEEISSNPEAEKTADTHATVSRLSRALPWAAFAAAMAIVLLMALASLRPKALPNPAVARVELSLPAGVELYVNTARSTVLSPDGKRVAFLGVLGGLRQLYVRRLDQFDAVPIQGTELASTCFFSPDSSAVGIVVPNGTLKKVSLADGLVVPLAHDVDSSVGASWGVDDRITFGRAGTLWQVPASGRGSEKQLTTLDGGKHEILQSWPTAVGGGKTILFTSVTGSGRDAAHIESLSIATGKRSVIIESGSFPVYAPSGHLIFFRDGALLAVQFDPDQLKLTGTPVRVIEKLAVDTTGAPLVDVSSSGSLIYPPDSATTRLSWVSRQGLEEPINDTPRNYANPRVSPDGRRIAVQAAGDLWIQDTARATFTRLTSTDTVGNSYPLWTPDGNRVIFRTLTGLRWVEADGSGRSKGIPGTSLQDYPTSFPDNETLVFTRINHADTAGDIYIFSLGDKPEAHRLVQTPAYEGGAKVSPDGHWMAYASDESGQMQVYILPFPGLGRRIQVSTEGGRAPIWNPSGRELFYLNGNKMMVVDVSTSSEPPLSTPRLLFNQPHAFGSNNTIANYDVSRDGQRFVMVKDESGAGRLNIVLNWFEELKRLVPAR